MGFLDPATTYFKKHGVIVDADLQPLEVGDVIHKPMHLGLYRIVNFTGLDSQYGPLCVVETLGVPDNRQRYDDKYIGVDHCYKVTQDPEDWYKYHWLLNDLAYYRAHKEQKNEEEEGEDYGIEEVS